MNKNLHDIDKIFRDGLDDHPEPAPPGVWDAVNNDLDKKQAFHFKEKYYRLKRMALVLLLFIFSGIAALLYFGSAGKSKNELLVKDQKQIQSRDQTTDASSVAGDAGKTATKNEKTPENKSTSVKEPEPAIENTHAAKEKIDMAAAKLQETGNSQPNENSIVPDSKINQKSTMPVASEGQLITESSAAKINNNKKIKLPATNSAADANIANESVATQQLQKANTMQFASNNHKKTGSIANTENNLALATNENLQRQDDTRQAAEGEQGVIAAPTVNQTKIISPLTAYLYQSPLILSEIEQPAPGPFKKIEQAPFLKSIVQNDSLKNAIALAKKMKASSAHSISLMPFISPNHSFTRLQDNSPFSGPGRNKNAAEREERQSTSFSAGVLFNYGLSKAVILQSGVVFSSAKTNISPKTIYVRPDNNGHPRYEFNCASGYSYIDTKTGSAPAIGDSIQVMGSSSTISYIAVPVSLIYVWQKGKFLLKPGIGVAINFLTAGKSATSFNNAGNSQKEIAPISGLKNAYVDASVGFGTEYMLNRKISIGVRPLLRMAVTSINKNTPIKAYQNYLGLETGIKINL